VHRCVVVPAAAASASSIHGTLHDANGRPWPAGPAREPPSTGATTVASTARVDGQTGGGVDPNGREHPTDRRVAEARVCRLRTHRVAVYARRKEGTVAELAYVPRERVRPAGVRLDGDVIGRGGRSRCRRSSCLAVRPAERSLDRQSVALPGCGVASLTSPPSPWRASCPGSRAPPHQARPIAKTAEVVRGRSWAERVTMEVPSLPETPSRTTSSRAA
jgi:hypothetical protein